MAAEELAANAAEKGLVAGVAALALQEKVLPHSWHLKAFGQPCQAKGSATAGRAQQENLPVLYAHRYALCASVQPPSAICALVQIAWALLTVGVLFGGSEAVPLWTVCPCCI